MRTELAIKNSIISVGGLVMQIVLRFVLQTFFILYLGKLALGVNGVFTNLLTLFSLSELGIGTAIVLGMYAPVAQGNTEKIASYMHLYKKAYTIIGIVIFVVGITCLPFLPFLIKGKMIEHIYWIYLLFLLNSVVSYFFTYYRMLFTAFQKEYINVVNVTFFTILQSVLQCITLYLTRSFIAFLLIQIICTIASNVVITHKAKTTYPEIIAAMRTAPKLLAEEKNKLKKNIFELVGAKMGGVVLNGTDMVLISAVIGTGIAGVYSNYALIFTTIAALFSKVISATAGNIGNLSVESDSKIGLSVFKKYYFLNLILCFFTASCLYNMINPFILLWIGKKFLLSEGVLLVIVLNFFTQQFRTPTLVFITSYGTLRFQGLKSVIESILNLALSLLFLVVFKLGIAGVLLGTIVTNLLVNSWFDNLQIFHNGFQQPVKAFLFKQYRDIGLSLLVIFCFHQVLLQLSISNPWIQLIVNGSVTVLVNSLLVFLLFRKNEHFQYFWNMIQTENRRKEV
ncbi:MAG: transporter [Streptococcaceae bacterium]|jgi:O-antigen/teichoic acid export membrane protein|nr:transporter [Streptococcaceae bacterium]